jgi:hypothetical protein
MRDLWGGGRPAGGGQALRTALRLAIRTARAAMAAMFVGALIASALEPLSRSKRGYRRPTPRPGADSLTQMDAAKQEAMQRTRR